MANALLEFLQNAQPYKGEGNQLRKRFPKTYGFLGGVLGTAPDQFEGSVLDPLSAQVRQGAEMGYIPGLLAAGAPPVKGATGLGALAGMFVGKGSKTWDALQASKAMQLEKAGVDARKIWAETGTWKAPDGKWRQEIPDNTANVLNFGKNQEGKMFQTLDHQGLYDAYPAQQYTNAKITSESTLPAHLQKTFSNERSGAYLHNGIDGDPLIEATAYTPDNAKSTLLHELQHAVQAKEGWVNGGNPDAASFLLKNARDDALSKFGGIKTSMDDLNWRAGELSSAKYLKTLQDLSAKSNIKPSQITNLSPWYEYSDDIRSALGPMPKKAGSSRDNWLNGAASIMYRKEFQKAGMPEYRLRDYLEKDAKTLKSEYRKIDRERQKKLPQAKEFYGTEKKFDDISKLSNHEQYLRIAGEAEARATQARMPLDAAQRRATFPADSYDVPLNQLILRGLVN